MDKKMIENAEAPATHSRKNSDTEVPAGSQVQSPLESKESLIRKITELRTQIRSLAHDGRGFIAPVEHINNLLAELSGSEFESNKLQLTETIQRNIAQLSELFNDAMHDTFISVDYEKFEEFLEELIESYVKSPPFEQRLALTFNPCKKEICAGMVVQFKRKDIKSILLNAYTNALQHGKAKNLTISVDGNESDAPNGRYLLITLTDDGNGIDPAVYPDIDQGRQRTTKEIAGGRNKIDHGTFLKTLRSIIENEEYGGRLTIENRHISAHPVDHGVSLKISLPLNRQNPAEITDEFTSALASSEQEMRQNEATAPFQSSEIPHERRGFGRRKLLGVIGGTTVAAAITAVGARVIISSGSKKEKFASSEISPEITHVPVTDIEVNERGDIVSFALHTLHGDMRYERGNPKHDFEFLQEANIGGMSIVGFRPDAGGAYGKEQYFIGRSDAGIFAQIPYGYEKAFMTVPYDESGNLAAAQKENVFPMRDTYFDALKRSWKSTSVRLLESRSLPSHWQPTDGAIRQISQMRESESTQYLNNFNKAIQRLRKLDDLFAMDPDNAFIDSREELRERLRTLTHRCDVAGPNLMETLRTSPLTQEEVTLAITKMHYLCFKNIKPDDAQRLTAA